MSSSTSKAPSAAGPSRSSLPRSPSEGEVASDGEVEQDQLAFTIELPLIPQIQLFKNIFNTGKLLAAYCWDDPLWSTLAAVALPCSNCTKHPETCKVPEGSPRCAFCTGKKTCSLGKLLWYRYFAHRCNQDLAYSRRFLEMHGTPAQRVSWTIPEDVWRRYDELLHLSMSATKVLVELNMLDEQDSRAIDRSKLRCFQEAQEQETLLAAKRKRVNASPPPKVCPKKRRLAKVVEERRVEEPVVEEVPRLVRLVIPPSRPAPSVPGLAPLGSERSSVALPLVSAHATGRLGSVQDPSPLAQLADLVDHIKASCEDPAVPKIVPRILSQHPYRVENERLAARVCLLESQLASSRQENATLTSALHDTSVSLEAHQGELDQLRESVSSAAQQQELYDRLLDQVETLKRALPGPPNESLVDRFRGLEEDLHLARKSRAKYLSRFESSNRCNKELETSLVQQQSLVDESNALAVRQRKKIEALQEEVHRFRERALFAEKMIRGYPKEGSYSVSLPPLSEVHGELNEALASLRRVATFAHRLFRCDPASVLHQHNRYMGVIIDVVILFLQCGLDTSDEDVLALNFQLALQYMEAAHFIHAELHLQSLSSIQWFFANAAEREEGIYHLVLAHSRFSDDAPFLNVAQHAGFIAPFSDSLEPPLHCRMFALEPALPHHGAGNWEDLVPAVPSLDTLMQEWEAMMSSYIRFVTKTPLPQGDPQGEGSAHHEEVSALQEGEGGGGGGWSYCRLPLFLPDPLSPTLLASAASPPSLPPCFGSVANLVIDIMADKDNEDIYESPGSIECRNHSEGNPGEDDPMEDGPVVP
ncbi:hypothetical protein GG344DRAFT_82639 [Lentinula edodes]|nr:hypothetical protein GG344DRAFT_82639 [Lentinula edodes]